jgi:hypothetical protein
VLQQDSGYNEEFFPNLLEDPTVLLKTKIRSKLFLSNHLIHTFADTLALTEKSIKLKSSTLSQHEDKMIMSFLGYQQARKKEDELKTMQSRLNTVQSMLEKLITGLSKTTDQQQFNAVTQSLLSSGVLKVATAPSSR